MYFIEMAADDECGSQVLASGEIMATAAGHESLDACSSGRLSKPVQVECKLKSMLHVLIL